MSKILKYIFRIHPITGEWQGPDLARIRQECKDHYGGNLIAVNVTGFVTPPTRGDRAQYFSIIVPAITQGFKDLGHNLDPSDKSDNDSVHTILKKKFIQPKTTRSKTGELITWPPTTKGMSREEFRKFVDSAVSWAAEHLNVDINITIDERR